MRRLKVFESMTLNGFFAGPGGDMSWAHAAGASPELKELTEQNASSPGVLVFGRVTYQMMASYWPTPLAAKNDPVVAKGMNEAEKFVISRTLKSLDWENATILEGDLPVAISMLKQQAGKDLVVLGSGSVVTQLAQARLVDEYQFIVRPTALGSGQTLFGHVRDRLELRLTSSRAVDDGSLVLTYVPAG